MIRETTEQVLKDGGHLYDIRLVKETEESAKAWTKRKATIMASAPSVRFVEDDKGELVIVLHFIPDAEGEEFDPSKLTEADLLRELGSIDSKRPGQSVKNSIEYEETL
jgi:hypothetical protein